MSKKNQVIEYLKNQFSSIAHVYTHFRYLDQINDFPTICLFINEDDWDHFESTVTRHDMMLSIRGYIRGENPIDIEDQLIQEIEEIVEAILNPSLIESIKVDSIETDEGLFQPYGVIDVKLQIMISNL